MADDIPKTLKKVYRTMHKALLSVSITVRDACRSLIDWIDSTEMTREIRKIERSHNKAIERSKRNNRTVKRCKHGRTQRTRVENKRDLSWAYDDIDWKMD